MATKYLAVYNELVAGSKRRKLVKSVAISMPTVDDHPLQPIQVMAVTPDKYQLG
jgi:hypothetical protein